MKYVCFLLVDLENFQPSGSAGIMQPLSSDHSEDNRANSVPNSNKGAASKAGVVADESM